MAGQKAAQPAIEFKKGGMREANMVIESRFRWEKVAEIRRLSPKSQITRPQRDKSRSARPNSLNMVSNGMDVESSIPSAFPSKHASPYGEEHALKIRKPYTITKQRERWSEEEHQKFLEALELYGRTWRRIEEHIGTKTAVQIRSHAQKFFTKVARESTVTGPSTMKPIVIPPPRPKRKPLRPYPRKLGHPSGKENPAIEPLKSPFLSNTFISNQENGSPTSVLSAFGSETMNSMILNRQNNCTSPILSASGSNGSRVPTTIVDEENTSPLQGLTSGRITTQDQCAMESDSSPDDGSGSEQSLLTRKQPSTLKLFGRTVLVSHPDEKPSTTVGIKMVQSSEPPPPSMIQSHSINIDTGLNSQIQSPHPTVLNRDHLESSIKGPWNIWAGGVPPMLYCLPLQKDPINPAHSGSVSVPWWSLYGNLMLPSIDPPKQVTDRSCREGLDDKDWQKEGSWTGSNTASFSGDTGDQNSDVLNSKKDEDIQDEEFAQLPVLRLSSGDKTATSTGECKRGFVPYKRCAVEKEVRHP